MKSATVRWLARGVGLALIVVVLVWLVDWKDRVTGADGREHVGRVVSRTASEVVLRTGTGDARIRIEDERAVRRGLLTTFATLGRRPGPALVALVLQLCGMILTFVRWRVLLHGADLPTPLRTAIRLGWIGTFFSHVLPGGTAGGDVLRAVFIARANAARKARAVLTVFADRVVGLLALCGIALCAILAAPRGSRFEEAGGIVTGLFAVGGAGALLLFSPRLRRILGLPRVLARLPGQTLFREIRLAIEVYARRPGALAGAGLLALASHACVLFAFSGYGRALGEPLPLLAVLAAIPVAQMLQAIPGLPGGWGVGEFAFFFFLPAAGVPASQAVALSITYRATHALLSLPGGLLLARLGPPPETEAQPLS